MAKTKSSGLSTFDRFKEVAEKADTSNLSSGEIAALHEHGVDISKLKPASRGGRPFRFSVEQELLIVSLIEKGFSIASVADQFKTHTQTIRNIVDRYTGIKQE